jgi:hypothetical protein
VTADRVDEDRIAVALPHTERAIVDLDRPVAPVLGVEIEEAQIGRRRGRERQALRRERQPRERHAVELTVGAHLEPTAGRAEPDRGRIPAGVVVREETAVEAPRHVGEVERADQPFVDPSALQEGERRVARRCLGAVSVLEPSELRQEPAPAQRQEALLQERLALRCVARVQEVERARA